MTAPATAGHYTPKYRMVWEGQKWFGSRASKSIEVERGIVSTSGANAQVVSSTIPASMNASQSYLVSVTMKNTGNVAWNKAGMIRLGAVGDASGDAYKFGPARIDIPAGTSVLPGSQYTFTFTMTAPAAQRSYSPQYGMVWEGHQWFGSQKSQSVRVVSTPAFQVECLLHNSPPVLRQGPKPLRVRFTDQSETTGTSSYQWDIDNDGKTDYTTKNPSHTYPAAGNYTVKLTVTNAAGSDTEIKTNYITVTSSAITPVPTVKPTPAPTGLPTAQFTASTMQGQYPLTVQFTDQSVSTRNELRINGTSTMTGLRIIPKTRPIPTRPGNIFTVKLTVTNAAGSDTEIKTNYITVSSSPILTGDCYGAEACNPTGNPIGGGAGYTRIISGTEAGVKYVVSTKAELLTALRSAKAGEMVFVKGYCCH